MTSASSRPLIVGISGASGSIISRELVDALLELERPVVVVASNAARMVWQEELDESYNAAVARWSEHPYFSAYAISDLFAPIASGTFPTAGMIIAPASMNTVASLAHGMTPNLLLRAADVTLKERRPLTLIPRETPLHAIHLENLLTLSRLGATILPPEPPFYLKPLDMDGVVRFVVQRALVASGVIDGLPDDMQYRDHER
ncbi:MAG: UbiX family flavin prenyltransferase [Chloroflexota bacterium]|nr:UbiX family flavin prenyltransferase [Chloroflexota bacterium]MDE2961095.1 UbiX family flavin prenyltransferase [Chloroflexota bacterium]